MRKAQILPALALVSFMTMAAVNGKDVSKTNGDTAENTPNTAEAIAWNVDGPHTEINFSVKHFFTPVTGTFRDYQVDFQFDRENPENSSLKVTIDVASVDTKNERRDNHLRSGDFFNAAEHPDMTFESTSVRQLSESQLIATGDLTIKGVSREVELPIQLLGRQMGHVTAYVTVRGIPLIGELTEQGCRVRRAVRVRFGGPHDDGRDYEGNVQLALVNDIHVVHDRFDIHDHRFNKP